jgi:hypothetical protein
LFRFFDTPLLLQKLRIITMADALKAEGNKLFAAKDFQAAA